MKLEAKPIDQLKRTRRFILSNEKVLLEQLEVDGEVDVAKHSEASLKKE